MIVRIPQWDSLNLLMMIWNRDFEAAQEAGYIAPAWTNASTFTCLPCRKRSPHD
jgi:hypothetical protein